MQVTLDVIREIVTNKDYKPFAGDIRTSIIEEFGERAVGKMKKNRAYGIIQIDDNLLVSVGWGGIGYYDGFAIINLVSHNISIDSMLIMVEETGIRFWLREKECSKDIRSERLVLTFEPLPDSPEFVLSKIMTGRGAAFEWLEKFLSGNWKGK
jgi:hypothetical protein